MAPLWLMLLATGVGAVAIAGVAILLAVGAQQGLFRPGTASVERATVVRQSGALLAWGRGNCLVSVYPAGLILETSPVRPPVLLREDITGLRAVRRAGARLLAVDHVRSWGNTPLVILTAPDSELAQAIAEMAGRPIAA